MFLIRERKHRLDPYLYQGVTLAAFTLCMKERAPFFTEKERFCFAENTNQF